MHDLASGFAFAETLKKLKERQNKLAKQEDKQHKQLLKTRGALDETTTLMDRLSEYDPTNYRADAKSRHISNVAGGRRVLPKFRTPCRRRRVRP